MPIARALDEEAFESIDRSALFVESLRQALPMELEVMPNGRRILGLEE